MEKQLFRPLPCPTADWVAASHSVSLIHITHVTVIICHNVWFYCVAQFTAEIYFCGWFRMLAGKCLFCLSSVLLWSHPWSLLEHSPNSVFTVLQLRSSGMPFLFSLTVSQQLMFFFVKPSESSGEEKEIVLAQFVATSFCFPCNFCHCGMCCCQLLCHALSFAKYTLCRRSI